MESIISAFAEGVGTIVADVTSLASGILPVALPLLGIGIAVSYGLKFTKKVTK